MPRNTHSPIGVQPTATTLKSYFALFLMLYGTLLVAAYPTLGAAVIAAAAVVLGAVSYYRLD